MQIHFNYIEGPALRVLAKALVEIAEIQEQQLNARVGASGIGGAIQGGGGVMLCAEQRQDLANAEANRQDDAYREELQAKRDATKKTRAKKEPEQAAPEPAPKPAPEPAPAKPVVSLEEVRAVCAAKSNSGKAPQVKQLLQKFGAAKLTDVDPAKFADLLTEAEAL